VKIIGKIFEVRGRFKGVITVVIDIPEEQYTEAFAPRQSVKVEKMEEKSGS